jgi:hypothetical protein
MIKRLNYIVESTLKTMITEAPEQETDNSPSSAKDSPFTPAEEKFLGKFDAYGTQQLGIIYSISDIGIREFIGRSGKDLNVTPGVLLSLLRNNIIKLVPYTGFGKNDDYTIELQLSLDDVAGLGAKDKEKVEAGSAGAGGAAGGAPMSAPAPGPEVAWVVKYGDILRESVKITKQLMTETKKSGNDVKVPAEKTRVIKNLPQEFVKHLEHVIKLINKKAKTTYAKERLIADVLDVLQLNMNLTPKQINQSVQLHKSQKRLQKYMEKL